MISVIIPVFKTADFLEELVARLHRALDSAGRRHEIICINDCCPGGSLVVLKKILREDARLTIVDLKENVGQHKAVLAGMAYAAGNWVAVMDADIQDPPEALPELIDIAQKNQAVVFAGRRGIYQSRRRHFTSWIFKRALALAARVPADAGMFFVAPRDVKEKLLRMRGGKPFVVAMLGMAGARKISHPVQREKRRSGKSGYSSFKRMGVGARALMCALSCRWGRPPLRIPDYTNCVRVVIKRSDLSSLPASR